MDDIGNWVRTELWDRVPVSISVIDRNFRIMEANNTFKQTYGEWKGHLCYEIYKGRSEPCEKCTAVKSFEDGQVRVNEEEGVARNGGPSYYFVQMVPLTRKDNTIPYMIEMSTDITSTKILEKEKLEAERLAAVGQTVAGLAHGVKNLLMGIEGGMYVVRSGMNKGDPDRIMKGWDMLERDIARITSFVKEFLEFAKGRTPTVALIDPNRPATNVFNLFLDTARLKGIRLEKKLQDNIAYALMDEEAIHTCLVNLVSNALDACSISDRTERLVTLLTYEDNGVLVFEVSDNGVGMDYDVKKRIFTNFFSTKGSDKGTGLGLLTTRKIVQEHGGKVSFESKQGIGSSFRLEFQKDRLPQPKEDEDK